jgi:glycosyltransferase involved in cell wall biosynthesis
MLQSPDFIINGDFLCRTLTGIERYSYEITTRLDAMPVAQHIALYVPDNAKIIPPYKTIQILQSGKALGSRIIWEQFIFGPYVKKHHGTAVDFSNCSPVICPGVAFIHDIYNQLYPSHAKSMKEVFTDWYSRFMYRYTARHAKQLVTVSFFSRSQIAKKFNIPENSIAVIYSGWENFRTVQEDASIFSLYPDLKKGQFFFTLGSLSSRKNLKWIAAYAEQHQKSIFVISGNIRKNELPPSFEKLTSLPNIHLAGYLPDGQIKALMSSCKAFIFPSYYEGFGTPPLEALSCGAQIIIGNAASLPEIYGSCAHYIDPFSINVDLDDLLKQQTDLPQHLLEKYTYQNAAVKMSRMLEELLHEQNKKNTH